MVDCHVSLKIFEVRIRFRGSGRYFVLLIFTQLLTRGDNPLITNLSDVFFVDNRLILNQLLLIFNVLYLIIKYFHSILRCHISIRCDIIISAIFFANYTGNLGVINSP